MRKRALSAVLTIITIIVTSCASTSPEPAPVEELPVSAPVQSPGLSVVSADDSFGEYFFGEDSSRVLMMGDTMCLNMKTPEGWQLDYDFASWAGYDVGFLPEAAYGPDSTNIQFYILGFLEEGDPKSYADFIAVDAQYYIWQGYSVSTCDVPFTPDDTTGMIDYGMCEMYGLPNSAVEILLVIETSEANAVLCFAAKGEPEPEKIEEKKAGFLELCRSVVINAPMKFPDEMFE